MKRTLAIILVSMVLGFLGTYFVVRRELFDPSSYALAVWRPQVVVLCLVAWLALWLTPGWRLVVLSRNLPTRLPFHLAVYIHVATVLGGAVTPGYTGGAPVTAMGLNRLGVPLGQALGITVQTIVLDLVFFAWSVPASLTFLLATGQLPLPLVTRWLALLLVLVVVVLAVVLALYPRLMVRTLLWLATKRFLRRFGRRLSRAARDYYRGALRFRSMRWSRWLLLHLLTAVGWTAGFVLFWGLLLLFDNRVGAWAVLAVLDLIILVGNVVPTPGGSGFMETVVGFGAQALEGSTRVAAPLLVWRLLTFYVAFLLGPVATGLILASSFGRRQAAAAGDADDGPGDATRR